MGRTKLKLKPFVDKYLQKGYINFRRNEKNLIEIVTPQYTSKLDNQYEEIFKAYERLCNREYNGYVLSKGPLISAMRRSKFYELQKPRPKHKYEFRERSLKEIKNMTTKKRQKKRVLETSGNLEKKKRVDTSPLSSKDSGYETAECSPDIQSPVLSPDHMPVQPESSENLEKIPRVFLNPPKFSEILDVDNLDIDMKEIKDLELSDEECEKLIEDVFSDGVSINELDEYLCNPDPSADNIGKYCEKSQGGATGDMNSTNVDPLPGNMNSANVDPLPGNEGQFFKGAILLICMPDDGQMIEPCLSVQESAGGVTGDINSWNVCTLYGNDGQVFKGVTGDMNSSNADSLHGNDRQILNGGVTEDVNSLNIMNPLQGNDGQVNSLNIMNPLQGNDGQVNSLSFMNPLQGNYGQIFEGGVTGDINSWNVDHLHGNDGTFFREGVTEDINSSNVDPLHGNDGQILTGGVTEDINPWNVFTLYGNDGQFFKGRVTGDMNSSNADPLHGIEGQSFKGGVVEDINSWNVVPLQENDGQTLKGSGADQMDFLIDHTYSQQP